jgi:hypothetical protein
MLSVANFSEEHGAIGSHNARCRDDITIVDIWMRVEGNPPVVALNMLQCRFHPLRQAKPRRVDVVAISGERLGRISSEKTRVFVCGYQLGIDD